MNKVFAILLLSCLSAAAFAQKIASPSLPISLQPSGSVYQKFCLQLPSTAGAAEVKAAILEQKALIRASGCDLALSHAIESPGGWHFDFAQTWHGIPVYGASIKATLTKGMRFMNLLNNLQSFTAQGPTHQHSEANLRNLLPSMLDEGYPDFHLVENHLQYRLQDAQLVACHLVIYTANTMSWELLIADQDLSILQRRDLAAYRKPLKVTAVDTVGYAMVFNPDPLTTSGVVYGGNYVDNNDADNAFLNAQRVPVVLKDITWTGSEFILTGPYVEITDREAPTGAPATSIDGNFNFTRNQQGFEDVMTYYHLDTMQRYIQSLGFMNLQNGPLKADPHGVNSQDNSHFVPAGADTRLGFGEGGVDDAEDADVIIHEYGHALSYAGSPGSNSGTERQGLDEGIGDYFAASYSRGLSYNFWKNTFTWDGHNEFWPGRSASNPTMYPPGTSNIYDFGEIWASVLMEVYLQIGKTNSDKVVLQSLYGNATNMRLSDAALVVIDADSLLFGGAHHDEYQMAFCSRNILTGSASGEPCFVSTGVETEALALDWTIFPNPAHDKVSLVILGNSQHLNLSYKIVDLFGRVLQQASLKTAQTDLPITELASGLYMIQLSADNGWSATRRLQID